MISHKTEKQFKIIRLKFSNHPILNDVIGDEAIDFVSPEELQNGPYSSVLIGPNGTGKSQILRIVSDIIEDLKKRVGSKNTLIGGIRYNYELVLYSSGKSYIVTQKYFVEINKKTKKPRAKVEIVINLYDLENNVPIVSKEKIILSDELLPSNIIVLSYLVNDKFRFEYRKENSYYSYLGVRDTAGSARTRSFSNRIIQYTIQHLLESRDDSFIKEVNSLINYDTDFLEIKYKLRYKEHFFTGELKEHDFIKLFKNWKKFSKRESEPFSVKFYKGFAKEKPGEIKKVVKLLNSISKDKIFNLSDDDKFYVNLLDKKSWGKYIEHLDTLIRLDLIEQSTLLFKKKSRNPSEKEVELGNFSSGEFHLFTSYIALKAKVKPGSLILIDEPEISLHPNWQMRYVHDLKKFFEEVKFQGCHFLIATHSHFIVSDLQNETSEIVKIERSSNNNIVAQRIKRNTFGLSAEEVLFKIFQIRSVRNYSFAISLRELLHHLSNNSIDGKRINDLIKDLSKVELDRNDPLTQILKEANEYVQNL